MQLYSQYQRDLTNRYFQEKALEEERQRREAERRRQEEQRRKASQHGAFGQTLQTVGMIGGAIAGGLSTGTPQGAIAGSSLGSAGASTIMNLFPNIGGTEPSGSNPYYDKPSDMARLGSTINTGLQAYGMYSQAAAARAKEDLMNEIKADMQRNVNSGISPGPGAPASEQFFDYKNATSQQISDRIKSLPSWQNATGLFGEQLVNDSAALSIANNTYDQISQSAMAGLQFINGLENNRAKQQALQNWQNTYGQSRADLIPKYGLESMQQSVQSGIVQADRTTTQEQTAEFDRLAKLALESAKMGSYDASVFTTGVADANPELAQQYKALADSYVREATLKKQNAANTATLELKKDQYELSLKALENTPKDSEVHSTLVDITAGLAEDAVGISDGQALFSQLGKDVKAADDPTAKSIQANAERFVNALMNPNPTTGQQLTKEETIAVILDSQSQKDPQGRIIPNSLSPIGEAMLRQVERSKSIEDIINQTNLTTALEEAKRKQQERLSLWNRTLNFFGFGDDSGPQGGVQGNVTGPSGNQDMYNFFMSE